MGMIAIELPTNISSILQEIKIDGKLIKQDFADHITCLYLNKNVSMEVIQELIPIIYDITKDVKPFIIKADKYKSFPKGKYGHPCIIEVKSKELNSLREKIKKALEKNDIKYNDKFPKFLAHITLGYFKDEVDDCKFDLIAWPVNKICLYGGDDNKEKVFIEFPFGGGKEKHSSEYVDQLAGHFEKLAIK